MNAMVQHITCHILAISAASLSTLFLSWLLAISVGSKNLSQTQYSDPIPWPQREQALPTKSTKTKSTNNRSLAQGFSLHTLDKTTAAIEINAADLDYDLKLSAVSGESFSGMGSFEMNPLELGRHDQQVFALTELDHKPIVMYRPTYDLAKSLQRAGISDTLVEAHVMIHEDGHVSLISYEYLPHPELKPEVDRIIEKLRFTSPKKNGIKVKAEFLLPLHLEGT